MIAFSHTYKGNERAYVQAKLRLLVTKSASVLMLTLLISSTFSFFFPASVGATINQTINFQSKIVNKTTGLNLATGTPACIKAGADTCDFQIRIWNDVSASSTTPSTGNLMFTQTFQDVEIGDNNGIFNLVINSCGSAQSGNSEWGTSTGTCTVVDDSDADSDDGVNFDRADLWVEVSFATADTSGSLGSFSETFSRQQFRSVPSAFHAQEATTLSGTPASGFVQLQPTSAQAATNTTNTLINLNETSAGTPDLINLAVAGTSRFLVNNSGEVTTERLALWDAIPGTDSYLRIDNSTNTQSSGNLNPIYVSTTNTSTAGVTQGVYSIVNTGAANNPGTLRAFRGEINYTSTAGTGVSVGVSTANTIAAGAVLGQAFGGSLSVVNNGTLSYTTGGFSAITNGATGIATNRIVGLEANSTNNAGGLAGSGGAGVFGQLGLAAYANNNGDVNGDIVGAFVQVQNSGTSTAGHQYGVYVRNDVNTGTTIGGDEYDFFAFASTGGTITGNHYAYYSGVVTGGANNYGLYIDGATGGANDRSIYTDSGDTQLNGGRLAVWDAVPGTDSYIRVDNSTNTQTSGDLNPIYVTSTNDTASGTTRGVYSIVNTGATNDPNFLEGLVGVVNYSSSTAITSGTARGIDGTVNFTNGGVSSGATAFGGRGAIVNSSGSTLAGYNSGLYGRFVNSGTVTGPTHGVSSDYYNLSGGSVSFLTGIVDNVQTDVGSTTTDLTALYTYATVNGPVTNSAIGLSSIISGTGSATDAFAGFFSVNTLAVSNSATGIKIEDVTVGAVDNYGLYLVGASGGSGVNRAIYTASGDTQLNGGRLGVWDGIPATDSYIRVDNSTNTQTSGNLYPIYVTATNDSSGGQTFGLRSIVNTGATNTPGNLRAIRGEINYTSSGTGTNANTFGGVLTVSNGVLSGASGGSFSATVSGGTVADFTGMRTDYFIQQNGTVTDGRMIYGDGFNFGTVTNNLVGLSAFISNSNDVSSGGTVAGTVTGAFLGFLNQATTGGFASSVTGDVEGVHILSDNANLVGGNQYGINLDLRNDYTGDVTGNVYGFRVGYGGGDTQFYAPVGGNFYGVYVKDHANVSVAGTNYGIYIDGMTGAATGNYSFYVNQGISRFAPAQTTQASINIAPTAAVDPATPNSGDLWWNATNLYFYDGTTNIDLLAGTGSCTTCFHQNGDAYGTLATLGTTDANDLRFIQNGTEVMRIGASQVAINNPSPVGYATLQVSATSNPILALEDIGNGVTYLAQDGGNGTVLAAEQSIRLRTGTNFGSGPLASGTDRVVIDGTDGQAAFYGNSGGSDALSIGSTTNASGLAFNRDILTGGIYNSGYSAYQMIASSANNNLDLQMYDGAGSLIKDNAFTVDGTSGYIGIGVQNATQPLDIAGTQTGATNMYTALINSAANGTGDTYGVRSTITTDTTNNPGSLRAVRGEVVYNTSGTAPNAYALSGNVTTNDGTIGLVIGTSGYTSNVNSTVSAMWGILGEAHNDSNFGYTTTLAGLSSLVSSGQSGGGITATGDEMFGLQLDARNNIDSVLNDKFYGQSNIVFNFSVVANDFDGIYVDQRNFFGGGADGDVGGNMNGINLRIENDPSATGVAGDIKGIYVNYVEAGNANNAYGVEINLAGTGIISNDAAGVVVRSVDLAGTVNNYGVYIAGATNATNNYGLYVAGGDTAQIHLDRTNGTGIEFGAGAASGANDITTSDGSLDIAGNVTIGGVCSDSDGGDGGVDGCDVAETFASDQTLEKGEVVTLDPTATEDWKKIVRTTGNQDLAIGIISTNPTLIMGNSAFSNNRAFPVGLVGVLPTKVVSENGLIHRGDFVTVSNTAGRAMKANAGDATIGMALEDQTTAEETINVLVSRNNQSTNNVDELKLANAQAGIRTNEQGQIEYRDVGGNWTVLAGQSQNSNTPDTNWTDNNGVLSNNNTGGVVIGAQTSDSKLTISNDVSVVNGIHFVKVAAEGTITIGGYDSEIGIRVNPTTQALEFKDKVTTGWTAFTGLLLANTRVDAGVASQVGTQEMITGWGFVKGDDISVTMTETIDLAGRTFKNIPVIVVNSFGQSSTQPTDLSSCSDAVNVHMQGYAATDHNFKLNVSSDSALGATQYYCYTWTATGAK